MTIGRTLARHLLKTMLLIGMALCSGMVSYATHLRSGEITIERECNSNFVRIHLKVYINTASVNNSQLGGNSLNEGHINFGDGSFQIIPRTQNTPRPDLGVNIGVAEYSTTHTYGGPGVYKISYYEKDRSTGVLNIPFSDDIPYVASTTINIDDAIGCNNYPRLTIAPLDHACIGRIFTHNAGVIDPEGDSLSYELSTPAGNNFAPVAGYLSPNSAQFYNDFAHGNEAGDGSPTFSIDPITGVITWDAPGVQGEFNIAFVTKEWRKNTVTDEFVLLSATVRDMQIIVEDCTNNRPDLTTPANVCVTAGTIIDKTIIGIDPDLDPVKIEPFSEIFTVPMPATYSPSPPAFSSSDPNAQQIFQWQTDCSHVRDQAYQVIYKITDAPAHQTPLVTFKSWSIKVISPPPTWVSADLDLVQRHGELKWNNLSCANADRIQIWRKVGGYNYVPPPCFTGLPAYLGYQLVAEVEPGVTSFSDTGNDRGLAAGAYYCYRLVAVYENPIAKSVASNEICIGPIKADAPVITNVTVEETGVSDGAIRVSWRSPFDMDQTQFPKPYTYEVYRGEGFESEFSTMVKVSDQISDTTFVDVGIDAEGMPYHYTVVVYSRTQFDPTIIPVDTAAVASSVRLEIIPGEQKLELSWDALVPWSNYVSGNPWHLIYRGTDENNLILIDSVDVTLNGFVYVDEGQYQDAGIDENQKYFYKIMTRGTYGNPKINEKDNKPFLQDNFSQVFNVYPDNELPPCKPTLAIEVYDCDEFLSAATCGPEEFLNTIYWTPKEEEGCRSDIRSYNIYVAKNDINGVYELLATNVRDTFFVETNLTSLARCYKVSAVDGKGQESELSDPVCNDNCPYYELPNVFTPNGDGCNDVFSAYHDSAGSNPNCLVTNVNRCPRFVNAVRISIVNRWGKVVYTYNSQGGNKSVYIEWDGHDNDGTALEAGNYYYIADVTFDAVDPDKKNSTLKGWVHLLR